MIFTKDVKELRKLLGLNQTELAEKLGVSKNTISNYERGGVIPMNKQLMIEGMLSYLKSGNNNEGDSNITNTGTISGGNDLSADQENKILKKKIKELEDENKELRNQLHEMSLMNGKLALEISKNARKKN